MVVLAKRALRFKLDEGGSPSLPGQVLHEACACLRAMCHHPAGKVTRCGMQAGAGVCAASDPRRCAATPHPTGPASSHPLAHPTGASA